MANEISASAQLSATKNGVTLNNSVGLTVQASKDMAGDQMTQNVQIVGTSAEALDVGDVSTIGYVLLKNLDTTNFVQIALDSGVSTQIFAKLRAGDVALFPAATATIYAKADTANCNLLVMALEL
jgi:hypothetical protein